MAEIRVAVRQDLPAAPVLNVVFKLDGFWFFFVRDFRELFGKRKI